MNFWKNLSLPQCLRNKSQARLSHNQLFCRCFQKKYSVQKNFTYSSILPKSGVRNILAQNLPIADRCCKKGLLSATRMSHHPQQYLQFCRSCSNAEELCGVRHQTACFYINLFPEIGRCILITHKRAHGLPDQAGEHQF